MMTHSPRWLACCGLFLGMALVSNVAAEPGFWDQFESPVVSSDGVWTDWIIDGDWRIQKHAVIGHYRLLDANEHRIAFGSMEQCFGELQRRREAGELDVMLPQVVICIHGLRGNRSSLQEMRRAIAEQGECSVVNFGYASTCGTVQEQAWALESVLRNLRGVHEVSFVAHSMGCILVRHLLYKFDQQGNPPPLEFRRMVMIAPPNHGAQVVDTLAKRPLLELLVGQALDQFAPSRGWPLLEQQLATPEFEFGIIAGGRQDEFGYLPRVPGDDDGLLSVRSQYLEGATAFLQVKGLHQTMPRSSEVQAATLQFLQLGQF